MAEPSTLTSAAATTFVSGAVLSHILPLIDANAAFGAVIGAALVGSTNKDLPAWKRFGSFLFSAMCGYGAAGEIVARELAKQSFLPALVGALVIVPLSLKIVAAIPDFDLGAALRRWLGNGE